MNTNDLNEKLTKYLSNFKDEMHSEVDASHCNADTKDLVEQLSRQTFYLMDDFRTAMVNELKKF